MEKTCTRIYLTNQSIQCHKETKSWLNDNYIWFIFRVYSERLNYIVSLHLCDPGINHRQLLLTVASSRAIHSPITLPRGSVYRNVASWCGVTEKQTNICYNAVSRNNNLLLFFITLYYSVFLNQWVPSPPIPGCWRREKEKLILNFLLLRGISNIWTLILYLKNEHALKYHGAYKPQLPCYALEE